MRQGATVIYMILTVCKYTLRYATLRYVSASFHTGSNDAEQDFEI